MTQNKDLKTLQEEFVERWGFMRGFPVFDACRADLSALIEQAKKEVAEKQRITMDRETFEKIWQHSGDTLSFKHKQFKSDLSELIEQKERETAIAFGFFVRDKIQDGGTGARIDEYFDEFKAQQT